MEDAKTLLKSQVKKQVIVNTSQSGFSLLLTYPYQYVCVISLDKCLSQD